MGDQYGYDFPLYPNQLDSQEYFNYSPPTWSPDSSWGNTNVNPLAIDPTVTQYWPIDDSFQSSPELSTSPMSSQAATPPAPEEPVVKVPRKRGRQPQPSKRKAHNEIEQKYRNTVNAAIQGLQRAVPQLSSSDGNSLGDRPQLTKAAILIGATTYIKQLEQEREKLLEENKVFRDAVMRERLLSEMRTFRQ
jgi:hypothetical protein